MREDRGFVPAGETLRHLGQLRGTQHAGSNNCRATVLHHSAHRHGDGKRQTANGGQGSGTGFFFTHKIGNQEYPFVVTNKHVVMSMREGALSFLQRKDMLPTLGTGFRADITDWTQAWFGHPSADIDIAV